MSSLIQKETSDLPVLRVIKQNDDGVVVQLPTVDVPVKMSEAYFSKYKSDHSYQIVYDIK